MKTDKTDETDLVGNGQFLKVVFGDEPEDARPVLVSFSGNPTNVAAKGWFGRPWPDSYDVNIELPADSNNYFSLAVFMPDEAGVFRRQKTRFHALHAVMLDDVGSKVPNERLTLLPSWLLETSPGNYQAGYLLSEPLRDGRTADHLMNAIVAAGLCDPGANGPRTRLARLPIGMNGKHSPQFACRMLEWSPELRYSVEELVDGLQIEMVPVDRPMRQGSRPRQDTPVDGDPVWIPCPEENAVLVALRNHGRYKAPLGEGRHDVTCPWLQEHTGQVDGGTAYFEPDDLWPVGGFKCLHGHCADRRIRDLLSFLEIEAGMARMKPIIRVMPGEMNRVVDAAERELALSGRHYQRGGLIVTVITDPGTRETRVDNISQPALVRALSAAATWERYDGRSADWVRADPPARHAAVLFDSTSYPHLPVLNGLARQPYLRPDGSLMTAAGYDSATGMFGVFDGRDFSVNPKPSPAQAKVALTRLKDLLKEFSFASASDLAGALAAILTASIRPSLNHAPMFHVRAHMVGSGKSYLCELITAFSTPQRGTPTTFPADDEECRKMLLAELLRVPAVVEFDNLTSDLLAHKSLCTVLTSEFMSGRILGVSKTATVSTRTLFLSSGNNVGPVQDMTRRCISIHLDPGCEIPAARSFSRPELVREVLRERGRYVSAALTIVRAWIVAGRPETSCQSLAGFGDWSGLCRQPLLWLGCADPTDSVFVAMSDDPDRETLGRLLTAWQSVFGRTAAMVREAVGQSERRIEEHSELREVLCDIAEERGEINRRKLGRWIKRHAGRIVDGRRFVRADGNRSAEAWLVEEVESVSSVLSVSTPSRGKSVKHSPDKVKVEACVVHPAQLSLLR
ncbi:MAG: RepB family DNA primase [Proteobacteria bacterium]|nr:RepB family DNA primase [Pseudomonadota bacterium]MBU1688691.1 RepB family DNA primase [Pseudomonadota bacterium]